jgi:hypothetical protein
MILAFAAGVPSVRDRGGVCVFFSRKRLLYSERNRFFGSSILRVFFEKRVTKSQNFFLIFFWDFVFMSTGMGEEKQHLVPN